MKCVKYLSGEVRRLSEARANELVSLGVGKFCPKSEWKALRTVPVTQVTLTEGQTREVQRKADKKKGQQSKRDYRKS